MAPKKKDMNAPLLVPEDTYVRGKKLQELKVTPKAPKGELTNEDWCIPPSVHILPELRKTVEYWKQCATVQYAQRKDMNAPTRRKIVETEAAGKKPHTRKELQDLFKYLKGLNKQCVKRTGQFLKQLEKKETKELKREGLLKQITDVDSLMNEELREARRFADRRELFEKKYMIGSKLGEVTPPQRVLIVIELSDKLNTWIEEAKGEVTKLIREVIAPGETSTYNIATFSGSGQSLWIPGTPFQSKEDPKKGLEDSIKWLTKNVSPKTMGAQSFPPDWSAMLTRFGGEGATLPFHIYLVCSRSPEGSQSETLDTLRELRTADPPSKGGMLPMNIVAFDPTIEGDKEEKAFFEEVAGPNGTFMIDTSADDLLGLDKMLKAVGVKKKQLDKLNKKLDKMEDLSERVAEDRSLFQTQVALQRMIENDFEIIDWALKNDTPIPGPEI
eukprot:TRINITY_DN54581_c0_g1_i1.p1 TRINITY_DN54581_c0_g1~~TRINITY_DN54581_c0_g1_i1.p1  ORF type:complete len:492 (-),score=110.16 TRINITY_DN54581_c0_g1_i1:156-1484(-)